MTKIAGLLFGAAIIAGAAYGGAARPVKTENGLISGVAVAGGGITAYKGVPFAAPPVGQLRWQAPHSPAKWQGVRTADHSGANCIQNIVTERKPWTFEFMAHGEVSEDCLYLNIWTP